MKRPKPRGSAFEEWVEWYEECTGDTFRLDPNETLEFDPRHGFMTVLIKPEEDALCVLKRAGDGKYWYRKAKEWANELGLSRMMTFTKNDPNIHLRYFRRE